MDSRWYCLRDVAGQPVSLPRPLTQALWCDRAEEYNERHGGPASGYQLCHAPFDGWGRSGPTPSAFLDWTVSYTSDAQRLILESKGPCHRPSFACLGWGTRQGPWFWCTVAKLSGLSSFDVEGHQLDHLSSYTAHFSFLRVSGPSFISSVWQRHRPTSFRLPSLPLPLPLWHPVAHPRLGEDVGGVVRVIAQLAAELAYDGAHGPHVAAALLAQTRCSRCS